MRAQLSALQPYDQVYQLAKAQVQDRIKAGFGISCQGFCEFNFIDFVLLS